MSAWLVCLFVPHIIASVVEAVGDFPWLYLASLPAALGIVGDALFELAPENALRWYHALAVIIVLVVGTTGVALRR